jgi:hypothetical protein
VSDGFFQLTILLALIGAILLPTLAVRRRRTIRPRHQAAANRLYGPAAAPTPGLPAQRALPRYGLAAPAAGVTPAFERAFLSPTTGEQDGVQQDAGVPPAPGLPAPGVRVLSPSGLVLPAADRPALPRQRFVAPGHQPQNLSRQALPWSARAIPPAAGGFLPPVDQPPVRHQPGIFHQPRPVPGRPGHPPAARQTYVAPTFTPESFPDPPAEASGPPAAPHRPPVQLPAYFQQPPR